MKRKWIALILAVALLVTMVPLFKGLAFGTSEGGETCYEITEWKEYQNENKLKNIEPKLTNDSIILIHHGDAYTLWSLNELSDDAKTFIKKNRPLTGGAQNATITRWISGENKNLELKQPGNSKSDGTVKVEISKNKVTFKKSNAFSKVWIAELKVVTCPTAPTSPTTEAPTTATTAVETTTTTTEAPTTTTTTEEATTTTTEAATTTTTTEAATTTTTEAATTATTTEEATTTTTEAATTATTTEEATTTATEAATTATTTEEATTTATEAATTTTIITEAPTTTTTTEEITTTIPEIVAGDEDEKTTPTTTQPSEVVAGDEDEVDVAPTGENYLYRAVAILFILSGAVVLVPAIKKVRVKK